MLTPYVNNTESFSQLTLPFYRIEECQGDPMSTDKANVAAVAQKTEVESQDEIDEIMNEIQNLQQGVNAAVNTKPEEKPKLRAVPPVAEQPTEPALLTTVEEFRGSGDDASLEETLGAMKGETSGQGLLDQEDAAVEAAATAAESAAAENDVQEAEAEMQEEEAQVQEEEQTVEEVEEALEELPEEEVIEEQEEQEEEAPESIMDRIGEKITSAQTSDGTLSMTLSGTMTLKLKYEYEGQEVTIGFADNALKVYLSDGTEFKIPIGRKITRKAA